MSWWFLFSQISEFAYKWINSSLPLILIHTKDKNMAVRFKEQADGYPANVNLEPEYIECKFVL